MNFEQFVTAVQDSLAVGTVFNNPGGGSSKIFDCTRDRVSYVRGSSSFSVSVVDLYSAYSSFAGQRVSSSDLKSFAPSVFDSAARPAGHSCNCTFFFRVLQRLNLAGEIEGGGVRGNPYSVIVYSANAN